MRSSNFTVGRVSDSSARLTKSRLSTVGRRLEVACFEKNRRPVAEIITLEDVLHTLESRLNQTNYELSNSSLLLQVPRGYLLYNTTSLFIVLLNSGEFIKTKVKREKFIQGRALILKFNFDKIVKGKKKKKEKSYKF